MRGAKPKLGNVTPLTGNPAAENDRIMRERAKATADRLRPNGLSKAERVEWNRVARMLADPRLDRLKPHFVDAALELVRCNLRLKSFRDYFASNPVAERLECRATTRRGTPCQRTPLPHNGYCPSHQHLAETEDLHQLAA